MHLTPTVALVEMVWTYLALIGAVLHLTLMAAAVGDRRALVEAGTNGLRRRVAVGNIRNEAIRALKQAIFFLIGLGAMVTPMPVNSEVSRFAGAAVLALIFVELLIVLSAVLDWIDRRAALDLAAEELAHADAARYATLTATIRVDEQEKGEHANAD